jgi:hypothetical protein
MYGSRVARCRRRPGLARRSPVLPALGLVRWLDSFRSVATDAEKRDERRRAALSDIATDLVSAVAANRGRSADPGDPDLVSPGWLMALPSA